MRLTSLAAPPSDAIHFRGHAFRADKQFWHGTHRTVSPEETVQRLLRHKRTVGLTRLADITGLDRIGIPTVLAHRPNCPTLSNAAGKGYTFAAAAASAAMEAVEIYHAENVRLATIHLSYTALAERYPVIAARDLPLTKHPLFRPDRPETWVIGWDIVSQAEVAVPFACVAMVPPAEQRPTRWMPFAMGSNGLAGGNHFLEAFAAALYEVVERDAIACNRVAANRVGYRFRRVRIDTIQSPLVLDLLERFEAAAVTPLLFDCTVDTDIPCYMAIIYDLQVRHAGLYRGYGAHLDPAIAMVRALTEAAQSRLIAIAGSRDDYFRRDLLTHKLAGGDAGITGFEAIEPTVSATARPSEATPSFGGDVARIVEKLQRVGLHQVIGLDLSHQELGIPVVRVIVPGLEGYMFDHYRPGPRALAFAAANKPDR